MNVTRRTGPPVTRFRNISTARRVRTSTFKLLRMPATNQRLPVMRRDLITATAAIAGLSSFLFGALTNLPVALA